MRMSNDDGSMPCRTLYRDLQHYPFVSLLTKWNFLNVDFWKLIQGNHAIAKMTARCAQYVSALKIAGLGKRKISRRLRKNLHITIRWWNYYQSIPSNVITAPNDLNVSDRQTDRRTLLWHHLAIYAKHCRIKTRKPCYRKDDRAMRPIYRCPENFRESLSTPTTTFPDIFNGLLFR